MLSTTLNLLHKANAYTSRYRHLCAALGGVNKYGKTTPITLLQILDHNGLDDALWALRAVLPEQGKERDFISRMFAVGCAERVLPIWDKKYPKDKRVQIAIESACLYAHGELDEKDLYAAWAAARAAARAAAGAAAWDAAWAAARAAAWAAARAAAGAAAWDAAWAAARAAAGAAAWDAEVHYQEQLFRRLIFEGEPT